MQSIVDNPACWVFLVLNVDLNLPIKGKMDLLVSFLIFFMTHLHLAWHDLSSGLGYAPSFCLPPPNSQSQRDIVIEEKYIYARIQYLLSAMLVNHLIGHSQGTEYTLGYRGYKSMKLWSRNRQRNGQRRCQMHMSFLANFPNSITQCFQMGKSYFSMADFWNWKHNLWLLVDIALSTRWPIDIA